VFLHDHHEQTTSEPEVFELLAGVTVIGSGPDADLRLAGIDLRHGEIRRDDDDEYSYVALGRKHCQWPRGRQEAAAHR